MKKGGLRLRGVPPVEDGRKLNGSSGYTDTELQFLTNCESTILHPSILRDGMISQQEFATAYSGFCHEYSPPGRECPTGFNSLPGDIQGIFYDAVCETMPDPAQCVVNLNSLNTMSFGYIVSEQTLPQLQMQMQGLCMKLVGDVFAPVSTSSPNPSPVGSPPVDATVATSFGSGTNEQVPEREREPPQRPQPEGEAALDLPAIDTHTSAGPKSPNTSSQGSDDLVTYGPIIGIAVMAAACLLLVLYALYRRRASNRSEKQQMKSDGGSTTESDPEDPVTYPNALVVKKTPKHLSQFDVSEGAAAIALQMSGSEASSVSERSFGRGFLNQSKTVSVEEVEAAVDKANWDEVYKLASRLAEQEDLSTISSAGRPKKSGLNKERMAQRSHLREEDHERTRTLDELIDTRDWTGVAVTAALYAGESGYQKESVTSKTSFFGRSSGPRVSNVAREAAFQDISGRPRQSHQSALGASTVETSSDTSVDYDESPSLIKDTQLLQLKDSMDHAVGAGDWDQVVRISSEVENNGTFKSRHAVQPGSVVVSVPSTPSSTEVKSITSGNEAFKTLIDEMDRAMNRGDWALVGFYADKIREIKISAGDEQAENVSSRALVPVSRPQPIQSVRTEDSSISIMSKKNTLQKLVEAEKWKGVAIMAGLYEMEAKGSLSAESP